MASAVERGYPRPQLCRENWQSLNGEWDFRLGPKALWAHPSEVEWQARIVVPFSPETPASTVHETGFFRACWYRRTISAQALTERQRLLLRFGAVDCAATVWCNGRLAGRHVGGYTPFTVDLTPFLEPGEAEQTIVVRAFDDQLDLPERRGK